MKKYLPLILLLLGIILFAGVFMMVKNQKKVEPVNSDDESNLVDIPLDKRPVVILTPSSDGHYIKLKVDKIVIDVNSVDYELLYQTSAGITQGASGTEDLKGKNNFEKDLLLGTVSSGKYRYDEGVETGSVELKFRKDGKLYTKFKTDFHMQTKTKEISSLDGKYKKTFDNLPKNAFFITMNTVGISDSIQAVDSADGYYVFSSDPSLYKKN